MSSPSFPGGTSLSHLEVYEDAAPDGICGGSPHMHFASTEAYIVTEGRGSLQTIDADGFRETEIAAGAVVWFTAGTIHRAVNAGGLKVVVLMSNAGLPEAGDAVLTFPKDVVADAAQYAENVSLGDEKGRSARARRRRDLAVVGFETIRDAVLEGNRQPLEEFYAAAGALVRDRAGGWHGLVREGPLKEAEGALLNAEAVARGDLSHLRRATVHQKNASSSERAFGMCGHLSTYNLTDSEENPK